MPYQFALIKMLHNTKTETYHPIFYYDSPFPGPVEEQKMMRYKSKGHHTTGFKTREEAVTSAQELEAQLIAQHDIVRVEIDEADDIMWDGNDIPIDIDIEIRPLPEALKHS